MELIFNMAVTLLLLKGKRNYRRVVVNFEIHLYFFISYYISCVVCSFDLILNTRPTSSKPGQGSDVSVLGIKVMLGWELIKRY